MFRYPLANAPCAFAICNIRLVICAMSGQPRRDTRDTLMTSTVSRLSLSRRHNYISRLGIPCRTNCIVSACPLYDSVCPWRRPWHLVTSPFPAQPLGSRWKGFSTPFGSALVPRFTFHPCSTTSLAHVSPPSLWSFNYQQSIFGHVPQSFEVQSAEDLAGPLNVTVNCDLCTESAPATRFRN